MSPSGLLSLVLLAPAAPPADAPRLQRGHELTYTGTVTEAVDRPGVRFRREHDLEARVFVLDVQPTWADAAVLVLLRRSDDEAVSGAVPVVSGTTAARTPSPPAARLDLVRVHEDGTVHRLAPVGPAPLRFAADTPAQGLPAVLLDAFSPFEFGMFPPRPRDVGDKWSVASAAGRPAETWHTLEPEFVNAERCSRLLLMQQSADWEKPQTGRTSWQRLDAVCVSGHDGTARRVHRLIQQRDGAARDLAVRVEVKYELKDRAKLIGLTYDRYRREIEVAYAAGADIAPLVRDAVRLGPQPFEVRLRHLDEHLQANDPGTPYREAVLAVRRQLDASRRGETIHTPTPATPAAPVVPIPSPPTVGQPAADFRAGSFRLADSRGKPVVLVFFMPGQETTDPTLAIAEALHKRYAGRLAVVPLTVFADAAAGQKDRDRLKLTVPVYDGDAAGAAYGVETFPRFLVVDPAGKLRWAFAGVGAEVGYMVREQVEAVLPAGAVAPAGTNSPVAPAVPAAGSRP